MSLARTALRLAVCEALGADATIAALCPDRVFDSSIYSLDSSTPVPMIVVSTEDGSGTAWNQNGSTFKETCELSLEIACRERAPDNAQGEPQIGIPETDKELEASIDLIEHRALQAITSADTPQSRLVRQAVTRRVTKISSARFVSDATAMKLAIREVRLTVELKGEDVDNVLDAPTGPFALLPDPLRTVANAMPAGSPGQLTCQMIVDAMTGTVPQAFTGVDMTYAIKRPAYPPAAPLALTDPNIPDPFEDAITIPQEADSGP